MDLDRCEPSGTDLAGLGLLRDGPKRVMRDYMDPHFFSSFFILPEKMRNKK